MKSKALLATIIGSLFISTFNVVLGQEQPQDQVLPATADRPSGYLPPAWLPPVKSSDTSELQDRVLRKINEALSRGSISTVEATNFKEQLNNLNNTESRYRSLNLAIPTEVVQQNTQLLSELSLKLEQRLPIKPEISGADTLHVEIDDLISRALAQDKITSLQAEKYYSQLAQIESNLENLRSDQSRFPSESAALSLKLGSLKADLQKALLSKPSGAVRTSALSQSGASSDAPKGRALAGNQD